MPDPDGNWLTYIVLLIVLILTNAFFALSEIAVISLNDNKVQRLAENGDKRAKRILALVSEPSRFLSTIQVGVTLSGLLASAVAADRFAEMLVAALTFVPIPRPVLHIISLALITILLSFFTLVFGELVPKRFGMLYPEAIAYKISGLLTAIYRVEKPFVALLSASTNGILRLCGINPHDEPNKVTEEEIRMMVDVGNEKGVIEQSEKDMIDNIFEFDERTAGDVMTHRTELVAADADEKISDIIQLAIEEGYSRIPVYEEDIDNIIGILYVKDMLSLVGNPDYDSVSVRSIMREAMYVPESNNCSELLHSFKEKKLQMAIVVDEYGGTSGVVTMEDLLESIVGNIQDEYDNEEEEVRKISDTLYDFDGSVSLEDVEKLMNITFDEENDDYDTLGGLITDLLGYIPKEDEHPSVQIEDVIFSVLAVEDRRIAMVRAEKLPPPPPEPLPKEKSRKEKREREREEKE
ncbi:putative hemolysin [Harryflintia acetispora]|uniref:Hemolysin n=1 Tax=Harryflintia acetispora TaxID=1849041 RepID=A0A9X8Y7Z2_9FIRM|nr:putative hemolysin [Harryflintia acetispora]